MGYLYLFYTINSKICENKDKIIFELLAIFSVDET